MSKNKNQKINLKKLFLGFQNEMKEVLKTIRESTPHPSTKGEATEFNWIKWLNDYLPLRYRAEKATIIDLNGDCSDAIDIVIFDRQYSPFILNREKVLYVPAESVYAVIEVKQELNNSYIKYAGEKAFSARKLFRTSAPIYYAEGVYSPKKPGHIISGILCSKSSWEPPFGAAFEKVLSTLRGDKRIDIGCCVQSGSFEVKYQNNCISLSKSHKQDALLFFFLKLLSRLQQLGTVPAIDLEKYLSILKIQKEQKVLK
jgi:hypothetical protein